MTASRDDRGRTRAEEEFLRETRRRVVEYLTREGVPHGGVAKEPQWFLHPSVSVWAVRSGRVEGAIGWFAIAGDLPTDYISTADTADAREAVRKFAQRWAALARSMRDRVPDPDLSVGSPEDWPQLSELLHRRARLLADYASEDENWA
jgi:hypothetical protein